MAVEVKMPKLGMTMTQGKIIRWLKAEGDMVALDEPLFVVANDKVTIDVESPAEGIVLKAVASEGDLVDVGNIVAYIGKDGENISDVEKSKTSADTALNSSKQMENSIANSEISKRVILESPEKLRATPAAKALAKNMGIDLIAVKKFYGKSRIKRVDVEKYREKLNNIEVAAVPSYVDVNPSNIRLVAADRMTQNFTNVPHFYLGMKVDVTKIQEMLNNVRKKRTEEDDKPTFTDVLVWITARVIKEHPSINSQWNNGVIRQFRDVNFGIATDTSEGLVVPVIPQADSKTFWEIVQERSRVVRAAREGHLMPNDMTGGTFTLSNLGMFGIDVFQAILNSPECALLTVGAIENEFSLDGTEMKTTPFMKMSLTCDHRVLDGATGARFLKSLKAVMENPAKLLDKDLF